jgi:hypothetical protein
MLTTVVHEFCVKTHFLSGFEVERVDVVPLVLGRLRRKRSLNKDAGREIKMIETKWRCLKENADAWREMKMLEGSLAFARWEDVLVLVKSSGKVKRWLCLEEISKYLRLGWRYTKICLTLIKCCEVLPCLSLLEEKRCMREGGELILENGGGFYNRAGLAVNQRWRVCGKRLLFKGLGCCEDWDWIKEFCGTGYCSKRQTFCGYEA